MPFTTLFENNSGNLYVEVDDRTGVVYFQAGEDYENGTGVLADLDLVVQLRDSLTKFIEENNNA
jgi:hypothetical protein